MFIVVGVDVILVSVRNALFFVRVPKHCRLLKRIYLTFTAWAVSLNTREHGLGKTYRSCQKHTSLSL